MAMVEEDNAQKIAEFLASHPRVKKAKGTGFVLSFLIGSLVFSKHIVETTKYFSITISFAWFCWNKVDGTEILGNICFLETFVLLFTFDISDPEKSATEGDRRAVNISWLVGGHPVLDPMVLMSEAKRTIGILLNLLQSAGSLPSCLTITVVNW